MFRRLYCFAILLIFIAIAYDGVPAEKVWHVGRMVNGIGINIFPSDSSWVAIGFRYKTGALDDPDGREGLSHLFEHLSYSCSPSTSQLELDRFVKLHAGRVNATTNWFTTTYYWELPVEHWTYALDFELHRLVSFDIDENALALEKSIVLRELSDGSSCSNTNSISTMLAEYLDDVRFQPVGGTAESINAITLDDLKKFHSTRYIPGNLEIFVSGGLDDSAINSEITSRFAYIEKSAVGDTSVDKSLGKSHDPALLFDDQNSAGVFISLFPSYQAEAAKAVATALFSISGSPVVRLALVEERYLASLSVKTVRFPDYIAILVSFEPSGDLSVRKAWERISATARSFGESREFKTAFAAARKKALALYLRALESPFALVSNVCKGEKLEEHLQQRELLSKLDKGNMVESFCSDFRQMEVKLNHDVPGDMDVMLNRKKRSATAGETKYNDGEIVTMRFNDGPIVNLRQTDGRETSDIIVSFPFAALLDFPQDLFSSRTFFHSTRFGEPVTYRFEKLGWFWEIGSNAWRFWGLAENCSFAAALVCDILTAFYFNPEEYELQNALYASSSSAKDKVRQNLMSCAIKDRPVSGEKTFGEKVVDAFGSRHYCIAVDVPRIDNNLKMAFTRCFGSPSDKYKLAKPNLVRMPVTRLSDKVETHAGNESVTGIYLFGPAIDSQDYPCFLALAQMLGAGGGLSGSIPETVRTAHGYAYDVSLSVEYLFGATLLTSVAVTSTEKSDEVTRLMEDCIASVLNGEFSDIQARSAIDGAIASMLRTRDASNAAITLTLFYGEYISCSEASECILVGLKQLDPDKLRSHAMEKSYKAENSEVGN